VNIHESVAPHTSPDITRPECASLSGGSVLGTSRGLPRLAGSVDRQHAIGSHGKAAHSGIAASRLNPHEGDSSALDAEIAKIDTKEYMRNESNRPVIPVVAGMLW